MKNLFLIIAWTFLLVNAVVAQPAMERLNRGVVGFRVSEGGIFLSWRLLGSDQPDIGFEVYRYYAGGRKEKITQQALYKGTNYLDEGVDLGQEVTYSIRAIQNGKVVDESAFVWKSNGPIQQYVELPLRTPEGYTPGDVSVGDLDGDGTYEIIVHQTGVGKDNSQNGLTDRPILQAYRLDGTFLWEIDLGVNIREGAHYTQFIVYDLDGDGKAELVCRTADGTRDGVGNILGDADRDWRIHSVDSSNFGRVLSGDEFLTVFNGEDGRAMCSVPFVPERGDITAWGSPQRYDTNGNRADRFLAGVAYLDGEHPSLIMSRGYYNRTVIVAWDYQEKQLAQRWIFDTEDSQHPYSGQGFHSLSIADVDQDGKDEIVFGAMTVDDDGTGLYTTGLGHGDALHVGNLDPSRPGLEVFAIHELKGGAQGVGVSLQDAQTGEILFQGSLNEDVGRGVAANIDPHHSGAYMWWSGSRGLYDMQGVRVGGSPGAANFLTWWDGDLSREMLDKNRITKYGVGTIFEAIGASSINGTKATPNLSADIFGDWREKLILRTDDNQALRIYSSTIPTDHRVYTLMHDPQYRVAIAWQNVGYNQPPHVSYYLGTGMGPIEKPRIRIVTPSK